jgi:hypothetical protein
MLKLRFFWPDLLTFLASRLFEALALAALVWAAAFVSSSAPDVGSAVVSGKLDMFGAYLVVRTYFVMFGYLVLSALVFVGYELLGGLSSRARLLSQNVGVLLIHGTAIGLLSPSVTNTYWLAGAALVALTAIATVLVWWPWLARMRAN